MFTPNQAPNPLAQQSGPMPEMPRPLRLQSGYSAVIWQLMLFGVLLVVIANVLLGGQLVRMSSAIAAQAVLFVAGLFGFILLTTFVGSFIAINKERRSVQKMFTGDALAVWHYGGESWRVEQAERTKKNAGQVRSVVFGSIFMLFIFGLVVAYALYYIRTQEALRARTLGPNNGAVAEQMLGSVLTGVVPLMLGAIIAIVLGLILRGMGQRMRAQKADSAWLIFGPKGFYHQIEGHKAFLEVRDASAYLDQISFTLVQRYNSSRIIMKHDFRAPAGVDNDQVEALAERYRKLYNLR
jgi:hypothetical protein